MSRKLTTRHARFIHSATECMDLLSNELCAIDEAFPGLPTNTWSIQEKSSSSHEPTSITKLKKYILTINKEYMLCYLDVRHKDSDGVWHEAGPMMQTIQGLTTNLLKKVICEYYVPHIREDERGSVKAKVYIVYPMDETPTKIEVTLGVQYHNKYDVPFPVPEEYMTPTERVISLQRNTRYLQQEIAHLDQENDHLFQLVENTTRLHSLLKKEKKRLAEKVQNNNTRMANKIRELYKAQGIWDECPVCYTDILPEALVIRGCCHTICDSCDARCENCPICREKKV